MNIYEGGKQYNNSKADLWESIKIIMLETEPAQMIKKKKKKKKKING